MMVARGRRIGAIVVAIGLLAFGGVTAAQATGPQTTPAPKPIHWMMTPAALKLANIVPIRTRLAAAPIRELLSPGQRPVYPHNTVVAKFSSVGALRTAIAADRLPIGTTAVLYDPEVWSITPISEQRHPVNATAAVAALAHQHHLKIYVSPALNLTTVQTPVSSVPRWKRFIDSGMVAAMSKSVDGIELQTQSLERDAATFRLFVRTEVAAARAVRPTIVVLAGLSTNPPGAATTSTQLVTVIGLTRSLVSGYWMNIPAPGPLCPQCGAQRTGIAVDTFDRVL